MLGGLERLEDHARSQTIFPNLEASIEAIRFQSGSSFPTELRQLFEEIFMYASELEKAQGKVLDDRMAYDKHVKIKKFIEGKTVPAFKKVVEKHTGLEITHINAVLPGLDKSAIALFACRTTHQSEVIGDMLQSSEALSVQQIKRSNKSASDLINASMKLNHETGKVISGIKAIKISIIIPVGAFCLGDSIRNGSKLQFTSEEMVAVTLHEIGHALSQIETAADLCYTGYYGNNFLREINTLARKDPKHFISEAVNLSDQAIKNTDNRAVKIFLANSASLLRRASEADIDEDKYEEWMSKIDDYLSHREKISYQDRGSLLIWIFLIRLAVLCLIIIFSLIAYPMSALIVEVMKHPGDGRSSREKVTSRIQQSHERLADEYVSRFQMGKHFNTALIKMNKQYTEINKYGAASFNHILRDWGVIWLAITAISTPYRIIDYVGFVLSEKNSPYEESIQRLRRNVNNLIDVLKNSSLEAEVRNDIIDDIESMEKTINLNYPPEYRALKYVIDGLIKLPRNVVGIPLNSLLVDGGLGSDYEKLMHEVDELLSNRAFLYAAKTQRLFERG